MGSKRWGVRVGKGRTEKKREGGSEGRSNRNLEYSHSQQEQTYLDLFMLPRHQEVLRYSRRTSL